MTDQRINECTNNRVSYSECRMNNDTMNNDYKENKLEDR